MGLLMMGYYCTIKEQETVSFFDYEFFGAWIFGGAYFFLLSSILLSDVEAASSDYFEQYKSFQENISSTEETKFNKFQEQAQSDTVTRTWSSGLVV